MMATRRLLAIFTFLCLEQIVLAVFTNPPPAASEIDNPIYKLGQEIKITWKTNVQFTDLTMWQVDTGKRFDLQSNSKSQEYTWIASYQGTDPADGNTFSFRLFDTGKTQALFVSHRFNITDPSTKTTSAPTGTRTNNPNPPNTKTSNPATETATESNADDPSTGLSTGATAGVAVGAVAGVALIAGTGFMLWRRRRANKAAPIEVEEEDGQKYHYGPVEAPGDNTREGPWEMGGGATHFTHELPADNVQRT